MAWDRGHRGEDTRIDLETIRDTIAYMESDIGGSARLAGLRRALGKVLEEIAALEGPKEATPRKAESAHVVAFPGIRPRFIPWTAK